MAAHYGRRMLDREIVAAVVAGDPAGLAAAYDRHAAPLHAYCRSMLAEPADAADAVQDTFVTAASRLAGLRDPDRLKAWLFAVARNECHRRLRARSRTTDLDEAGEMTDASADVSAGAEQGELRELIRAAVAGLNPGDRDVIELNLRGQLDGPDLAAALGVSVNTAHALTSRARGQLERALGALLVARTGRESCEELSQLLTDWDGELTVLLRKRVARHIEHCAVCGARQHRELSPAALLTALPVFVLPPQLRQQVLHLVADAHPSAASHRESVLRQAGPFAASGFPVPVAVAAAARKTALSRRQAGYAAAAAVLLILGGTVTGLAASHSSRPAARADVRQLTDPPGQEAAAQSPPGSGAPGRRAASPTPALSPSPRVPASPSPDGLPASTPAAAPTSGRPASPGGQAPAAPVTPSITITPTTQPSAPASPAPSPGTVQLSTRQITMRFSPTTGQYTGVFTITAVGGPVSFSITAPPPSTGRLRVTPSADTLPAGQQDTVNLTVTGANSSGTATLTVSPGGATVAVNWIQPSGDG